ncbi:Lrp/AsnC family transcriptional regulator [Candidatus Pacearchaeota archaeon]|nr:Lrp/AsnC family transcriptional regulator [Candidatus Pacearchaeota archaeon]
MKLDKKDLKLLYELEKDARQPLTQIAKKLKTSQQVVSYRLQQLQENKVITEFYTMINFAKLGYSSYRTMIKLENISDESHAKLIKFLESHSNVLWLVECGGKWDLIVNFLAKNPVQYNGFLSEMQRKFKKIIQDYDLLLTIEGIYRGRNYLSEERRLVREQPYFGREVSQEKIDKTDLRILSYLSENARANSVEIGEKLNLTNNTIISRIKELNKKEIIQGFKPLIHLEKIGYQSYKALIKLRVIDVEHEKKIIDSFDSNVNVVGILKMIGMWEFEIEFEIQSREEMLKLSREIRTKFKGVIKEFEILPLYHEYKYNFFPRDLL